MNSPKLRFPNFTDEWSNVQLGELLEFNNGINADRDSYGKGRKFINVLDILNNEYIVYENIKGSVEVDAKTEKNNKVEYGDLVFLRSSETREDVGKCSVYLDKEEYCLFGGFVIRGKKIAEYDPYFLKLNLETPLIRHQIGSKSGGSTRFNVSQGILNSIDIRMPSIGEQKAISKFMDIFNKKIQLQQQKIDLLQEQKKGYIQEIFSQENKNLKYIKLEDAFDERNEKGFPEYELLAVTLKNGVTDRTDMKKDTSSDDKSNYKRVKVGDIAYNSMRMWQGASGYSNYNGIVSPAYTVLIPKGNIDSQFFAYLFKTDFMIYQFKKYSQGLTSDTWNLKYPLLKEIKVKIPPLDQQKRIVGFFTKIDLYINLQKKRLDILKKQKQAFMQQMFI